MPNVVNVVVHPTENVLLVVLLSPKPIYITDIVLLLAHQDIPNMKTDLVSHVTMIVVNVTESKKITVPSVVITLSYITILVSSHVHTVLTKITKPCLVTLVMIPVLIVKVQVQNNVWIVSSQDGYTSI
jgi:hypothetical protein